jgi:signal transduction histidine kinase
MTRPTITNIVTAWISGVRLERMLIAGFGSTLFLLVVVAASFGAIAFVLGVLGALVNLGILRGVLARKSSRKTIVEQSAQLAKQTKTLLENERALAQQLAEYRTLAEHLRLVNQTLEKANQDLDQFAYAASHDLKAPLRGIANLSEWLEEDLAPGMTDKSREHLRLLRGRVHRMEALINGILAYARASRTKAKLETIEVAPFLHDVVELLTPPQGVVTIDVPDSIPRLEVQKASFQQIWMNLIGNALKHGSCKGSRVHISARSEGDTLWCSVCDNGPGIAKQYHDRIFRIFHTLASRDKVEGAGIGLAIVKRLVDDRGGRVWVESEEGKGATFHFTWPLS